MSNPLFDTSLSFEERIDWLLKNLTVDEKLGWMASRLPGCERLCILPFGLGGEAAHGVEARNDQNGLGKPDYSTSFPQPIGMSATWDPDLIRDCGEVVGTEARVINKRHPGRGLSRWAPTVDIERDPRWGRNEEGYGEDPFLIGKMAGAYIEGMQGNEEKYLRCAATLKHFYANNTEEGRAWKTSDVDPRNKYELYLEPFRRCIEEHNAQGIMTAYNRINDKVGILNDDVKNILKKQYGLTHAVGDGGALNLVVSCQHYFGNHAEAIAAALKAGIDGMSDNPVMVEKAARDAFEQGLITEQDLDTAIRNKAMVAMRLGHFDGEKNPFAHYSEQDICTEKADALSLKAAEESLVLLKNENLLPLQKNETVSLLGPMADSWYQDWYGGEPPCKKTVKDGFDALGIPYTAFDGWNRVMLRFGKKGAYVNEDGSVSLSDTPDVFVMEDFGENCYLFKCVRTNKYLSMQMPKGPGVLYHPIAADAEKPFNWFTVQIFHFEEKDGQQILLNRFYWPVEIEEGRLMSGKGYGGTPVTIEIVEDGIAKAVKMAKSAKNAIVALGQTPLIPAKEEYDRHTMVLPPHQQKLMEAVLSANPNTALVLVANYPHLIPFAKEKVPAILLSASGSQQMGPAIANALFGLHAPAGRLNMTWYETDDLPSIDDYDIIRTKRTYRYYDGKPLFPFGFGCTYTSFRYSDFSVVLKDKDTLSFSFAVENTGSVTSDEVAQVYAIAPSSRTQKPLRQLVGFERLHAVKPGEKRIVSLTAPVSELRFYDVISRSLMVEAGEYRFFAGSSSADDALSAALFIPGEKPGKRDMKKITPANHYDDCENVTLLQGTIGYACIAPKLDVPYAIAAYRDCAFDEDCALLSLRLMSVQGGSVTVLLNGVEIGHWQGDTRTCEHRSAPPMSRFAEKEIAARARERRPIWEDIDFELPLDVPEGEIVLRMDGDIRISFLQCKKAPGERKIRLGIAN